MISQLSDQGLLHSFFQNETNYTKVGVDRMVRNKSQIGSSQSGKSPAKKSRKTGDSSDTSASTTNDVNSTSSTPAGEPRASVHKQNFYIVSFPIIFLFNILRSLLYQLFIIFKYIFTTSTRVVYRPVRRKECHLEAVNTSLDGGGQNNHPALINGDEIVEMSTPKSSGPGPGDPLLAKQKHHHRRAFEYISKALKIDEENEGWSYF